MEPGADTATPRSRAPTAGDSGQADTSQAQVKLPSITSLLRWGPAEDEQNYHAVSAAQAGHYDREYSAASAFHHPDAAISGNAPHYVSQVPRPYPDRNNAPPAPLRTSLSSTRSSYSSSYASPEGGQQLFPYPSGMVGSPLMHTTSFERDPPEGRETESSAQAERQSRKRRSNSLSQLTTSKFYDTPILPGFEHRRPSTSGPAIEFNQSVFSRSNLPPLPSLKPAGSFWPEAGPSRYGDQAHDQPRRASIGTTEEYRTLPAWSSASDFRDLRSNAPLPSSIPNPPTSMPQDAPYQQSWRPSAASFGLPENWAPPQSYPFQSPYSGGGPSGYYGRPVDPAADWRGNGMPTTLPRLPLSSREISNDSGAMHEDYTDAAKYNCPHCPKRFARPSSLRIHIHSHTGEKPFECKHCGRAFSVQSNLRRHLKIHAGVKPISTDFAQMTSGQTSGSTSGGNNSGDAIEGERGQRESAGTSPAMSMSEDPDPDDDRMTAVSTVSSAGSIPAILSSSSDVSRMNTPGNPN